MLKFPVTRCNILERISHKYQSSQPSACHSLKSCAKKALPSSVLNRTTMVYNLGDAPSSCTHGGLFYDMMRQQLTKGISSCTRAGSPSTTDRGRIGSSVSFACKGLLGPVCSRQPVFVIPVRGQSTNSRDNSTTVIYICALGIFMVGFAYAGVPLYRMFCQATGVGGQAIIGDTSRVEKMTPITQRVLKIRFNADTTASMQWSFRPQQAQIEVVPGETALAFYTAKNPTDKAIIGISTYNVVPFEAGQYFNKIQCFCFEEQRLNAHEEVDMPVFFYIDPDIMNDPKLEKLTSITLSYTFFEAKDGMSLPLPGYLQHTQST